ncbi:MAG TPA: hypothetical protein VMM78_08205, partial [Thermomicrobiales bacterium]|nr:hypothetical protein [Thermomicrobiales bacterium]
RGGLLNGLFRDHQTPGTGTIDVRAISERLRQLGYTGLVTLELSPVSLRSFWPWAPERILASARERMSYSGLTEETNASAEAPSGRHVRSMNQRG